MFAERSDWLPGESEGIESRCGHAIIALLERSAQSLTKLKLLEEGCDYPWPPENAEVDAMPEMKALKSFTTASALNLDTFPAWLRDKCVAIDRLVLLCCNGHGSAEWRDLWDAIRYVGFSRSSHIYTTWYKSEMENHS